jgi:hypothetical protein
VKEYQETILKNGVRVVNIKINDRTSLAEALQRSDLLSSPGFKMQFANVAMAHSETSAKVKGNQIPTRSIEREKKLGKTFVSENSIIKEWKALLELIDIANLLYNLSGYIRNSSTGSVLLVVNDKPILVEEIIRKIADNTFSLHRSGIKGYGLSDRNAFVQLNRYQKGTLKEAPDIRSSSVKSNYEKRLQDVKIISNLRMALDQF